LKRLFQAHGIADGPDPFAAGIELCGGLTAVIGRELQVLVELRRVLRDMTPLSDMLQ
jgi:hypothetical protein